ncbi:hypothetical protein V2G26_015728 [Clonostachys chloroleuca]
MSAFPPPPVNTIDWSNVGFKVREVNGHIESTWSKSTGEWSPLRFVADPYMRIHGMAPALNYGQQAYEGLKAFRTPNDAAITIFRPDRNARRMQHSADVVSMPRVPEELFLKAVRAAVALNAEFVPPRDGRRPLHPTPDLRLQRPARPEPPGRVHLRRLRHPHGRLPRDAPRQGPDPRGV